jgi:hypothetical protein
VGPNEQSCTVENTSKISSPQPFAIPSDLCRIFESLTKFNCYHWMETRKTVLKLSFGTQNFISEVAYLTLQN